MLNGGDIEYVTTCKYLGFHIVANTEFSTSVYEDLHGFFGSVNAILISIKRPKENVLMQLLYSNCVPKLTYGAAVKDLSATEMWLSIMPYVFSLIFDSGKESVTFVKFTVIM